MACRRRAWWIPRNYSLVLGTLLFAVACGGGGDGGTGPNPPSGPHPVQIAVVAGGGQTQRINTALSTAPAVVVKDGGGQPVAGIAVHFAVAVGEGTVTVPEAITDAQGIATVGGWTLGPLVGVQKLTATTQGTSLSVEISATGRLPHWTVMVYLAADNNVASFGILNIDQMEAAGTDPEVQVLLQGDFSQQQLSIEGCGSPQSCFNRPNYNSFRYLLNGSGNPTRGPNGPTIDLGSNRDFTNPSELNGFVQWAKQTAPAEHYALVLWNHGGGYAGLLQDVTSANGGFMLPGELPIALAGVGKIDVLELDMCLMGDYSTLSALSGIVDNVVFSQAVEPAPGQNYQRLFDAIQTSSSGDGKAIAAGFADAFSAEYSLAARRSITKSAFDMGLFTSFDADLSALASALRANLATLRPAIVEASAVSQKFEYPGFTDLVTFLDSLAVRIGDAGIRSQIAAVRNRATDPNFRLRSHAKSATVTGFGESDVSRARGLSVVLPSGVGADEFQAGGALTLSSYRAQFPGKAWTEFLTDFVSSQGTAATFDQGLNALELYLTWPSDVATAGTDLDLWVLEPTGDVFIPYLGIVTPNGTFTGDSYDQQLFYEGYFTRQVVLQGTYFFYGNLWIDPQNRQPVVDIQYRHGQAASFTSLYDPNFPQMSLATSWLMDPTPTFEEANAGSYTDLLLLATQDYVASSGSVGMRLPITATQSSQALTTTQSKTAKPTAAQLRTLRELHQTGAIQRAHEKLRQQPGSTRLRLNAVPNLRPLLPVRR